MRENIEFFIRKIIGYRMRRLKLFKLIRVRGMLWFLLWRTYFRFGITDWKEEMEG